MEKIVAIATATIFPRKPLALKINNFLSSEKYFQNLQPNSNGHLKSHSCLGYESDIICLGYLHVLPVLTQPWWYGITFNFSGQCTTHWGLYCEQNPQELKSGFLHGQEHVDILRVFSLEIDFQFPGCLFLICKQQKHRQIEN